MKLIMPDILERDIDFLIIKSFVDNVDFRNKILGMWNISCDASIISAAHSLSDEDGESDITFVLQTREKKIAVLIEDKINAIAMPNQASRYYLRGKKGIEKGEYDIFYVMIIAPEEYLSVNSEAQKYEKRLSYEEMQRVFCEGSLEFQMIDRALEKKAVGHEVEEVKEITRFWDDLYDYLEKEFPRLHLYGKKGDKRGIRHYWFSFKTPVKNATIVYKADRHYVDLELASLGGKYSEFIKENQKVLDKLEYSQIRTAGKSLAITVFTDEDPDCTSSFDSQREIMRAALEKVRYLQEKVLPEINIQI